MSTRESLETRVALLEEAVVNLRQEIKDTNDVIREESQVMRDTLRETNTNLARTNDRIGQLAESLASWKYAWPTITAILSLAALGIGWTHLGIAWVG